MKQRSHNETLLSVVSSFNSDLSPFKGEILQMSKVGDQELLAAWRDFPFPGKCERGGNSQLSLVYIRESRTQFLVVNFETLAEQIRSFVIVKATIENLEDLVMVLPDVVGVHLA